MINRPGTFTIDPAATKAETTAREATRRMEEDERRVAKPCCARCRRGTAALLGPCGYMKLCGCHTGAMS